MAKVNTNPKDYRAEPGGIPSGEESNIIHTGGAPSNPVPAPGGADERTGDMEEGITETSQLEQDISQLEFWIDESVQLLGDKNWNLRSEFTEDNDGVYVNDILDIDSLLTHMLENWKIGIEKNGPAYRIILTGRKGRVRSLESGGKTPITGLVNILYRYLTEIGPEELI